MVFEEQSTIEHIVYRIMIHIQSLLECERCQVLLVAEGSEYKEQDQKTASFSRVFDLERTDLDPNIPESERPQSPCEGRFPINVGITGYVATTGCTLNIVDAYKGLCCALIVT